MGRAGSAIIAVALVVLAGTAVRFDSPPGTVPPIAAAEVRSTFHFRYFIEGAANQSETTVLLETSDGGVSYGFATSSVLIRPLVSKGVGALPPLVRLHFEGSNPVEPSGNVELRDRSNVFLGRDPAGWKTSLRLYREVRYANLYNGVDLVYRLGAEGGLKYEFRLDRGVDPGRILVRYEGVEDVGIGDAGELLVEAMFGTLRDDAPVAFQADLPVRCGFRTKAPRLVGFDCPDRNPSLPLVIDPLLYATFLGGAGRDEARAIAVDASGSAYITGMTGSMDFPSTPGAWSTTGHGSFDMFVAKLNANGTELEYATFIGGENEDEGYAIAVDAAGRAYVTGYTLSPDFPVTAGALDPSLQGGDAFLVRLGPRGDSLEYATLLGGANFDEGLSVALDPEGGAYIAGETLSVDFPTTEGAIQPIANGGWDGFLVHLDVAGHALRYGTYLGGVFSDAAHAVAVDSLGDAFVAGYTLSSNFPVTPGAFQTLLAGDFDVFVAEVSPDGRTLVYSTYVGSKGLDQAADLVPGPGGAVDVAGATSSPTFPVTSDGFDRTPNGGTDAFYFRLAPMGMPAIFVDGNFIVSATVLRTNSAQITLETTFGDGMIVYTLDGTAPSFESRIYSGPFNLNRGATIRALAYNADFSESVETDPVELLLTAGPPFFSLVTSTPGGGTFSVSPTRSLYASNTPVTLYAIPNPGWSFLKWLGDASGTEAEITFSMTSDRCVEALFGSALFTRVTGGGSHRPVSASDFGLNGIQLLTAKRLRLFPT